VRYTSYLYVVAYHAALYAGLVVAIVFFYQTYVALDPHMWGDMHYRPVAPIAMYVCFVVMVLAVPVLAFCAPWWGLVGETLGPVDVPSSLSNRRTRGISAENKVCV